MNRYPKKYGGQLSWHKISLKRHSQNMERLPSETSAQEKFRNYQRQKGFYGQLPISLFQKSPLYLERRLDILLFRAHWVTSLYEARQWIRQGQVLLNGQVCLWKTQICVPGDIISLKSKGLYRRRLQRISLLLKRMKEKPHLLNFLEKIPDYLEVDWRIPSMILLTYPQSTTILWPSAFSLHEIS